MKTIGERIRWIREQKFPGHGGKTRMAKAMGIRLTSYVRYETDEVEPGVDILSKLFHATKANPQWVRFGVGDPFGPKSTKSPEEDAASLIVTLFRENENLKQRLESMEKKPGMAVAENVADYSSGAQVIRKPAGLSPEEWKRRRESIEQTLHHMALVPILGGRVAAGSPRNVFEQEIEDWALIYKNAIPNPKTTSALWVAGDSMEPYIPDGALVWVDYSIRDPEKIVHRRHPVAVVRIDEGVVLRRPERAKGHWLFLPENASSTNRPLVWDPKEEDNPVVGAMVAMWAKFD